jgi:hypothetical protein
MAENGFPRTGSTATKPTCVSKSPRLPDGRLVTDLAKSGDSYSSGQSSYWGTVVAGKYTTTDLKSEKANTLDQHV